MSRTTIKLLAWASLAFIVFVTLSPIGLRPHFAPVSLERFSAFAGTGLLFGLAYPRQFWLVATLVLGAAVLLELMQHLTPDRHGQESDAVVKFLGGAFGLGLSMLLNRMFVPLGTVSQVRSGVPEDAS
jgi:apolipoprotein N-acyltransferase